MVVVPLSCKIPRHGHLTSNNASTSIFFSFIVHITSLRISVLCWFALCSHIPTPDTSAGLDEKKVRSGCISKVGSFWLCLLRAIKSALDSEYPLIPTSQRSCSFSMILGIIWFEDLKGDQPYESCCWRLAILDVSKTTKWRSQHHLPPTHTPHTPAPSLYSANSDMHIWACACMPVCHESMWIHMCIAMHACLHLLCHVWPVYSSISTCACNHHLLGTIDAHAHTLHTGSGLPQCPVII